MQFHDKQSLAMPQTKLRSLKQCNDKQREIKIGKIFLFLIYMIYYLASIILTLLINILD